MMKPFNDSLDYAYGILWRLDPKVECINDLISNSFGRKRANVSIWSYNDLYLESVRRPHDLRDGSVLDQASLTSSSS